LQLCGSSARLNLLLIPSRAATLPVQPVLFLLGPHSWDPELAKHSPALGSYLGSQVFRPDGEE